MNKLGLVIILSVILFTCIADQDVPLRKNQYGFSIGDKQGTQQINFFLDFMCPDSKDSYIQWQKVRRTIDLNQQRIKLTYQFNPLTWHFYAFKITQAFFFVLKQGGSLQAQKYISYIFTNQDDFQQQNWMNKTVSQFLDEFAHRIALYNKVDQQKLRKQLQAGSQSYSEAKTHWKYTVGSNAVAGAPYFQLNGVRIDGAQDYKAADWINFIQKYRVTKPQLFKRY